MHILVTSCLGTQPPFCPSSPLPFIWFSIFSFCLVLIFVLFNWVTPFWPLQNTQDSSPCAAGHSTCRSDSFTWERQRICVTTSPLDQDTSSGRWGAGAGNIMRCKCFPAACSKAMEERNGLGSSFLGGGIPSGLKVTGARSPGKMGQAGCCSLDYSLEAALCEKARERRRKEKMDPHHFSSITKKAYQEGHDNSGHPEEMLFSSLCPDASCFTKGNPTPKCSAQRSENTHEHL